MLRAINFLRFYNLIKLNLSFAYSRFAKTPKIWGMPSAFSFEPTTNCNLRCPECPSGLRKFTRPIGDSNFAMYQKIVSEASKHAFYLTLYFQGEPFLNPDLFKMIRFAKRRNLYTSTSTNAHYLDQENTVKIIRSGLDRITISLDGLTQETYSKYRVGGNLKTVLSGIKNLVTAKKELHSSSPFIIIQYLAFSHNEHEIDEIKMLGKSLGVNEVKIKSAQIYAPDSSDLIPKNEKLSRYKKNANGKYEIKSKMANSCSRLWSSPVITQDGQMIPCCFDKDAQHTLGKLNGQSLKTIWNGETYNQFRKQVFTNRAEIDICKNCTEGTKVWL